MRWSQLPAYLQRYRRSANLQISARRFVGTTVAILGIPYLPRKVELLDPDIPFSSDTAKKISRA